MNKNKKITKKFSFPISGSLTEKMVEFYHEYGYLILTEYLSIECCQQLKDKADDWAGALFEDSADADKEEMLFSAAGDKQKNNRYFIESADCCRLFLQDDFQTWNKIGHNLLTEEEFKRVTINQSLYQVANSIGFTDPRVMQTMVIFKMPGNGAAVAPHQDATYLRTIPPSSTAFWIPLDDATLNNGCLWVLPSYHKGKVEPDSLFGVKNEGSAEPIKLSATSWNEEEFIPVEVSAGDLVLMHPLTPHRSFESKDKNHSRYAYAFHVVEAKGVEFPETNWIKGPVSRFASLS